MNILNVPCDDDEDDDVINNIINERKILKMINKNVLRVHKRIATNILV